MTNTLENKNKFLQYEMWKDCCIGCKFCCNKGQPDLDKAESLRFILDKLDDKEVYDYVIDKPETQKFINKMTDLLDYLLDEYDKEGKTHVVIGIGCTGGQHRSVSLTNYFADHYSEKYHVHRLHRDAIH